jgi:hypothetical protein
MNNLISNPIAGSAWVVVGALLVAWLQRRVAAAKSSAEWQRQGLRDKAEARLILDGLLAAVALLALYLLLDMIF